MGNLRTFPCMKFRFLHSLFKKSSVGFGETGRGNCACDMRHSENLMECETSYLKYDNNGQQKNRYAGKKQVESSAFCRLLPAFSDFTFCRNVADELCAECCTD